MTRRIPLLFAFLIFLLTSLTAQVTVTVVPSDTIVCFADSMAFRTVVTGPGPFSYQWQKNNVDIAFATDSLLAFPQLAVSDTGYYRCIISNSIDRDTSNSAHLRMHPKLNIDTLYRYNALGCPTDCKGQFKVKVSGGLLPYIYDWHGGFSQDTLVFGLCPGTHVFTVTDANNCSLSKDYFVDVLKLPKIDFTRIPDDTTIYLSNPNITVQFPDTAKPYIAGWDWNFGEDTTTTPGLNPATHTYSKTGTFKISLTFTDLNGCDTTIQQEITVKVANIVVYDVITPNGDGKNDFLKIVIKGDEQADYRKAYLETELIIYDRWGKKIFDQMNYKSEDWDGGGHSEGVYYYILKCQGQFGNDLFKGSMTIIGNKFSNTQ